MNHVYRSDSGLPIAPQVAASLSEYADGDSRTVAEVAALLTGSQLAGYSALPDPMPSVPRLRLKADAVRRLSAAERRMLLIAALSATDQVFVLLDAASVEIDAVLRSSLSGFFEVEDGRLRFSSPALRSAVVRHAGDDEVKHAHGALARALRRNGQAALSLWHSFLANPHDNNVDRSALLGLAKTQLDRGATQAARSIAEAVADRAGGPIRSRALALASHAAFLEGHVDDADRLLGSATVQHSGASARDLRLAIDTVRGRVHDDDDRRRRWGAQLLTLQRLLTAPGDRAAFTAMTTGYQHWWAAPHHADALMARAVLSTSRARPGWALTVRPEATTPLGEACIRLMEAGFQMQAGEFPSAASTLSEAMHRLPLAVPGGGVGSLIRLLREQGIMLDPLLIDLYESIASPHRIDHVAGGSKTGALTNAASQTRFARKRSVSAPTDPGLWPPSISGREKDVLVLVSEGLSNNAIGDRLGISARTVEVHLTNIYRKTGTSSRRELIVKALRTAAAHQ